MPWIRIVLICLASTVFEVHCTEEDGAISPELPGTFANVFPAWSPDGKTIAVSVDGVPQGRGIYLIDVDSWTTTGPIFETASQMASIQWSPSGEWLLFSMGAQLFRMHANGDSLTQLTYHGRHFFADWAPSDTLIAMSWSMNGDSSGVWLMGTDGSDQRFFALTGRHPRFDSYDSLLYGGWMRPYSPDTVHLALVWPADSSVRTVYAWVPGQPYLTYNYPCLSRLDRMVAVSIDVNIFTLTIQGTELTQLTTDGGTRPSWSPDGSQILYVKPTLEGGSLWIMDADGGNKTQVPGW